MENIGIDGVITALVTPYKNGKIDSFSLKKLLDKRTCCLALGTTGESAFLADKEKEKVLDCVFAETEAIIGIGGQTTSELVRQANVVKRYPAKAFLISPPPFSKCTAQGFTKHVKRAFDVLQRPLVLYNVPSRCGYSLPLESIAELSNEVCAVKDAGNDENYTKKLRAITKVICGSDERLLTERFDGVISVTSNVAPLLTGKVLCGEANAVEKEAFYALCKACFVEVSPVPVKYVLKTLGKIASDEMRLPLTTIGSKTKVFIDNVIKQYGEYYL